MVRLGSKARSGSGASGAPTSASLAAGHARPLRWTLWSRIPRGESPGFEHRWLVAKPHVAIKGSTWLPETGEGVLKPEIERYFRSNLERLTGGNSGAPLLFYCVTDCWMSWNAAKRALSWGYRRVYWYRDGIEVWQQFDLPTETVDPVPLLIR